MSLGMRRREQVVVGVQSNGPPTDEEWSRWLTLLGAQPARRLRVLIEAHDGGGPDAAQRKLLAHEVTRLTDYRTALITDSLMQRGIVIALSWLGIRTGAYGPRQVTDAVAYLELSPQETEWSLSTLNELRLEAGIDELLGDGRRSA